MHFWAFEHADESTQVAFGIAMIACWIVILGIVLVDWIRKKLKK